jgi:CRP/FNR family transcriptional regulator, cyclic AMP receptor protein
MENWNTQNRGLLSALPPELLRRLFAGAPSLRVEAGQTLFVTGDPGDGCYSVDRGLLKVSVFSASGRERILAIMGSGTLVGELSILDEGTRSATVAAVKDSELRFISRSRFMAFAEVHPEVYKHLLLLLAQRLRTTNVVIAASSFLPPNGRVARALLDLSDAFGQDIGGGRTLIRQKITQSDLAAITGMARENVSRILNSWKRQSAVTLLAGYYCLENREALEHEAAL